MTPENNLKRELSIARDAIDEEARRVSLAFSSEEPVARVFGNEILDHDSQSVDLSRLNNSAPLLLNHDPDRQIGVIERAWIDDDKKGRAVVRFGRSDLADEVFADVLDGIRELVSVSYVVNDWQRTKGEAKEADTFRAASWMPTEVSIVSIPADVTVGVGRSIEPSSETDEPTENNIKMENPELKIEVREVPDKRAEKIAALGRDFNAQNEAVAAIAGGKSVEEFTNELLAKRSVEPAAPKADEVKLDRKERKQYSLLRAMRQLADGRLDGFEKEVSDECAKRSGKEPEGFIVPWNALDRDLTAGTDSQGGYSVQTDVVAGSFIDALRNITLADRVGATFLTGLQGDVSIPKLSSAATAEWNTETETTTAGDAAFAQVTMTPKSLAALTGYSRQLLAQSSLDIEAVVRDDLARVLAVALDAAAINGSGASGEPTGILSTSGIGSVTSSGSVTHSHLVNLEKEVAVDKALMGNLYYVMNPVEKATLKTTEAASSTAVFLMDGSGEVNGYPAIASNQVPESNIVFGNFADLLVGVFGSGLDITVDPYTNAAKRAVRVVASMFCDVAVRHAESFAAITDA